MSDIIIGRRGGDTYFIREEGTPNGLYDSGERLYVRNVSGRVTAVPGDRELPTLRRLGIDWLNPGTRLGGLARYTAGLRAAEAALRRGDLGRIPGLLRAAQETALQSNFVADRERMRQIFQSGRQRIDAERATLHARIGVSNFLRTGPMAGPDHERWRAVTMMHYDYEAILHDFPHLGSPNPLPHRIGMW